ncbi:uncharacterized protein METZ01_LOCUS359107 [marine metagenome]|uniref:Uncharacterized protein n=1 Tax=marine metagenome TaxID=408172 RepID=A0A382S8M6_9ZZZZ
MLSYNNLMKVLLSVLLIAAHNAVFVKI